MNETNLHNHLYCVFDTLSGALHHFTIQSSDALAVRQILLTLSCPLKDNKVYCLCDIDSTLTPTELDIACHKFSSLSPRFVPWDSYKLPETVADSLAPLNLSESELDDLKNKSRSKIESIADSRN